MGLVKTTTSDASNDRLSNLIMGPPGSGKTYLANTIPVAKDSELVYVAADPGQLTLRHRSFTMLRYDGISGLDSQWLEDVYRDLRIGASNGSYKWAFIDGLDDIGKEILKQKKTMHTDARKAYGEMADLVRDWTLRVRDIKGLSTVFTVHMDFDKDDVETPYKPMFPGNQTLKEVMGWFDEVGCIRFIKVSETVTQRVIQFRPEVDPRYSVKDRSGALEPYEQPDLSAIYDKIHGAGIVTSGKADAYVVPIVRNPRSEKELSYLQGLAVTAKKSVDDVKNKAKELSKGEAAVKFLNDTEYNELVLWLGGTVEFKQ